MEAPWNGEKIGLFVRLLAIIFVLCAVLAVGIFLVEIFTNAENNSIEFKSPDLRTMIGMVSALYCFLLFLKVAFTGRAPKTWVPWR